MPPKRKSQPVQDVDATNYKTQWEQQRTMIHLQAQDLRDVNIAFKAVSESHKLVTAESLQLKAQVEDLKERLEWAEKRLTQTLESANNTSEAVCAISRITNNLGMCIDTLEMKLDRENKDKASRFGR